MSKKTMKKKWLILSVLGTLMIILGVVFAQESGKKASSYSPVVITEDFGTIMARMKERNPR